MNQLKNGKDISCVFEFEDRQYPLVASLNDSYFRCEQDCFVGQAYLLCKVIRKIPQGQSIKLDEIFDDIKKLPLNRAQRRKMPKIGCAERCLLLEETSTEEAYNQIEKYYNDPVSIPDDILDKARLNYAKDIFEL